MNLIAFILTIALSVPTHAGYQRCPEGWVSKNKFTYRLLKQMQGTRKVGDCKLEVRLCDISMGESKDGLVADVLINKNGQEYYIPLYVDQLSSSTHSNLTSGQREVIYKFLDENSDPLAGDLEQDRFTMRLNFERTKMLEVSLLRKNDYSFSKFIFWKLPQRLSCVESNRN